MVVKRAQYRPNPNPLLWHEETSVIVLSREEISKKLTSLLVEALYVEEKDVKDSARLKEHLDVEWADVLHLGFMIGREFNLKDCRAAFETAATVGDLVTYIETKLQEAVPQEQV